MLVDKSSDWLPSEKKKKRKSCDYDVGLEMSWVESNLSELDSTR